MARLMDDTASCRKEASEPSGASRLIASLVVAGSRSHSQMAIPVPQTDASSRSFPSVSPCVPRPCTPKGLDKPASPGSATR